MKDTAIPPPPAGAAAKRKAAATAAESEEVKKHQKQTWQISSTPLSLNSKLKASGCFRFSSGRKGAGLPLG